MKWILAACIEEYGEKRWKRMTEQEQVDMIAVFGTHLKLAIEFLIKYKRNEKNNKA